MERNGVVCHDLLVKKIMPKLSFDDQADFGLWKASVQEKLTEVLGMKEIAKNACPMSVNVVSREQKDGYTQVRFEFESEYGAIVPCYLLTPDGCNKKTPVVITLQGHNKMGVHSSIGDALCHETLDYDTGRGMFAVQAVRRGCIALAIEQRGMGERKALNTFDRRISFNPANENCYYEAMTALFMGRTLIGERCWDIMRAIDMLAQFPLCDTDKIVVTGNSGGGTASYYAACLDERIKICVPSCAFCTYEESILKYAHCSCNYIPGAYQWFDMQDLACLIAPRKLAIVAGEYDTAFKVKGVKTGYQTVEKIFEKAGEKNGCRLIITEKGHFWCDDIVWAVIGEEMQSLGW